MKEHQKYILNKNLDLNNENFFVKKGTLLEIVKIFDQTDPSIETKLSLKFDKINGNYVIDENEFKENLDQNVFKEIKNQKFFPGDCAVHSDKGRGAVESAWYDSFAKIYLYNVIIDSKIYTTTEDKLNSCE